MPMAKKDFEMPQHYVNKNNLFIKMFFKSKNLSDLNIMHQHFQGEEGLNGM